MQNIKIEYLSVDRLKPYEKNTRKHKDLDVKNIATSIEKYGFNDAIGIWGKDNIIVEGHGRLLAAKKLGMKEVPCVRLDHLTDEQRREYAIAHNATAELSEWEVDLLGEELAELDLSEFDFDFEVKADDDEENPYSIATNIPQYEPSEEKVSLEECTFIQKHDELVEKINNSSVSDEEKQFLLMAAARHVVFNYKNIAQYYVNASKEMQELMEDSALVIIDLDDAIKNGYTSMYEGIMALLGGEKNEE